eukprot:g1800.t1
MGREVERALIVTGHRDGKARIDQFAAKRFQARRLFQSNEVRFFLSRGASHRSFLDDETAIVGDLDPLVSHARTRARVLDLVRAFADRDREALSDAEAETSKLADPLSKALALEGSEALGGKWCNSDHPTNPACNYPKYPDFSLPPGPVPAPSPLPPADCICGSKWITDFASPLIATDMQPFSVHTADAFHDVSDEHPFHLPHIWSTCETPDESCELNVTSLTMLVHDDSPLFPNATSALELRAKLKSRQTLWEAAGLGKQDPSKTDKGNYTICRSINQRALDWALDNADPEVRQEYEKSGEPLVMVDDKEAPIGITGPQWIKDELVFTRRNASDGGSVVEVQSWKFDVGESPIHTKYLPSGMHYCKLLSPARAMEVARQVRRPKPEENRGRKIFAGTIVHSKRLGELEVLSPGLMAVDNHGKILFCAQASTTDDRSRAEAEAAALLASAGPPRDDPDVPISSPLANDSRFGSDGSRAHFTVADFEWIDLGERLLIPGFVDAHVHACQYGFMGLGVGLPLLSWLDKYTFPFESRFSDVDFAREMYAKSVTRHLRHGTTFCSYFATIHREASEELVKIARDMGQRVYVGKVNMDRNGAEKINYIETTEESVEETERFVDNVQGMNDPLATPVITPRFAPTCTPELMRTLASVSDRESLPVQTHMSENKGEIEWVKELHPECDSYADVYDKHGLLHDRTYLAHCVHCEGGELAHLAQRGSAVVHCPNSNFALRSGVCNVRSMLDRGVRVGLGTDVGGGTNPSILDAIRLTMCASVAA